MYHFSWTYLLTIAHVLLYKNTTNIADEDQVEIMEEVVRYLESDKSGVLGYTRMSAEWTQIAEKINKGGAIKRSDEDVALAVRSWQEQERDMALCLSRSIGFIVECGESKYKGKLTERLDDDCKQLVSDKMLDTSFRIKGAVSDIKTRLLFEKRTVEMEVALRVPDNKTQKGQIGWIKRQIEDCIKRQESLVKSLSRAVFIEPCLKNVRSHERIPLSNFERVYEYAVGGELREFKIVYVVDLGAKFASPTKFVGQSEAMLKAFYNAFVQHLVKWEPSAPKVSPKLANTEEESFIESVNRGEMDYISQPDTEAANSPTPLTTLFPNGYSRSA